MSEIYLLKDPILDEQDFYESFLKGTLEEKGYFSDQRVQVPDVEEFIFYINSSQSGSKDLFRNLVQIMMDYFVDLKQEIFLDQNFWRSYISTKLRNSTIRNHPQIRENFDNFRIIVLRALDWENYLYKAAIYGSILRDRLADANERDQYIDLIHENMDLFNYILKKRVFRNDVYP